MSADRAATRAGLASARNPLKTSRSLEEMTTLQFDPTPARGDVCALAGRTRTLADDTQVETGGSGASGLC
jgi:hypothetical protein